MTVPQIYSASTARSPQPAPTAPHNLRPPSSTASSHDGALACLPLERERISQCVVQPAHRAGRGGFALSQLETEGALALVQGISEFMC